MKKLLFTLIVAMIYSLSLQAQLITNFTINTNVDRKPISPFIYGSNGQSNDHDENITARRLGGNRLTGYNWENNYSNAGTDYINNSDNYLPYILNLPLNQYLVPNAVYKAFHDTSLSMNCNSLITLPMAGYVAADGSGPVTSGQVAPSYRWKKVVNQKGAAFLLTPDTADGNIYIDECLNNLIAEYGTSSASTGIKWYSMDNEWSLWNSTHPLLHPLQPTIAEAISKATALSATIKGMDSGAYVFGPADYGYNSFLNFQNAPDWLTYSSYGNFASAFLNGMKRASDTAGKRLLDVYDAHWYPEAEGDSAGTWVRVDGGNTYRGIAEARMQAPRTLWDSSYVEHSWIGQYYSPCVYVLALQHAIDAYNPGTKLAFTEFNYGGETHISGGIAIADVLGIFGKYGVYMSSYWGAINDYTSSAYKIYRNYDGRFHTFGDIHISATANNYRTASIYASLQSADTTQMNLIVMNKNYDSTLVANFSIKANTHYNHASIYAFNQSTNVIQLVDSLTNIASNQFSYTIPVLSVYHFVLTNNTLTTVTEPVNSISVSVYPNPASDKLKIDAGTAITNGSIQIFNVLGVNVFEEDNALIQNKEIDLTNFSPGIYFLKIADGKRKFEKKFVVQ